MNNQLSIMLSKYNTKLNNYNPHRIAIIIQYIIFKIVGLSPWKTNFPNSEHIRNVALRNHSTRHSTFGTVYNIALAVAYCSYFTWSFDVLIPRKNQSALSTTIGDNVHIVGIAATASIWMFYVLRQKLMIDIINQLVTVNSLLKRCELYEFKDNNTIYWILLGNFLMTTYLLILELFVYTPILVPIRMVPALISSWVLMQYSLLLDIVIKQFKGICSTILKLGDVDTDINLQTLFVRKVPLRRQIAHELIKIRDANQKLFKISGMISDFYGLPILISIGYFGVSSTCYSYFAILSFFDKFKGEIVVNYISFSSWFLIMLYGFVVMTANVARTVQQTERTAYVVHLLLDRCTIDERTYKDLVEFSCELLHQKMEFSAFGIISFDGSLLKTMAGTIVTYLVILIQL